jgi:hypothetical protein
MTFSPLDSQRDRLLGQVEGVVDDGQEVGGMPAQSSPEMLLVSTH